MVRKGLVEDALRLFDCIQRKGGQILGLGWVA